MRKSEKKKWWQKQCKGWVSHSNDKCFALVKNKYKHPPWYDNTINEDGK